MDDKKIKELPASSKLGSNVIRTRDNFEFFLSYKDLVNSLPLGIASVDVDGNVLYISDVTREIFQLPDNWEKGKTVADFLTKEAYGQYLTRRKGYAPGIKLKKQEYLMNRCDGSQFWAEVNSQVVDDGKGGIKCINHIIQDITEQKRVALALQDSERRFRSTFNGAGIPMSVSDKLGRPMLCNPAFLDMIGYTEDELRNMPFTMFSHPEDNVQEVPVFRDLVSGRIERYRMEKRYICKNGDIKWGLLSASVVRDETGFPAYTIRMFEDVTEMKKAEEALKRSEQKYRSLFENMTSGLILFELIYDEHNTLMDALYLEVNPMIEKISGRPKEFIVGKRLSELFPKELTEKWLRQLANSLANNVNESYQDYVPQMNKYFDMHAFVYDHNKIAVIVMDITERKAAEDALLVSENRYRSLFENMNTGYVLLAPDFDHDGKITDFTIIEVNPAFKELTHLQPKLVVNHKVGQFLNDLPYWIETYKEVGQTKKKKFVEHYFEGIDRFFYLWIFSPGSGYIATLFTDETERFKLNEEVDEYRQQLEELVVKRTEQLEDLNKRLQEEIKKQHELTMQVRVALEREKDSSDLKSRFISIASHEFRTPLTTISSSAQLLEKYGRSWDEKMYKSQFARIKEYVHYLTEIMDDMLTISKTENGKIQFLPVKTNMKTFMAGLSEDFRPLLTTGHELHVKDRLKKKIFYIDPKLINLILLNLLANAVKYSPAGGIIEFSVYEDTENLVFTIQDEGIGISEDDQKILFEPFHRGNNVGTIHGTGLGLSIVKNAVNLHGGKISFTSEIGTGTSFTVKLPRR